MPSVPKVDVASGSRGERALAEGVFGVTPNRHLLYEAVKHYRAQLHRGTHATKNRALVSGGGKKPWRQKGTGRARVGSSRNPLWRKGGTVFGPQVREYGYKLNGKVQRGALRSALSLRVKEDAVTVVQGLGPDKPSTKALKGKLDGLGVTTGRVLVVEDERALARLIAGYLTKAGMSAQVCHSGTEAVAAAQASEPDLIILDLGLPGLDGVEVCRQVRTFSDCYVVMLTARDDEVDKLVGLSVGADDYVTKPFSPRELIARVQAMLRRPRGALPEPVPRVGRAAGATKDRERPYGVAPRAPGALGRARTATRRRRSSGRPSRSTAQPAQAGPAAHRRWLVRAPARRPGRGW